MRRAISTIPSGTYSYEAYLDCSGDSFEPVIVKTNIKVGEDHLTIDFSGSSPQTRGPLNAGPAVAPTGAFIILKSFLDPEGAINHGAFRPIDFVNPEGTVLNARYPAPCGGFSEIRRCVESAVLGALAKAIPDRVTGDIKGTANHVYISGTDSSRVRPSSSTSILQEEQEPFRKAMEIIRSVPLQKETSGRSSLWSRSRISFRCLSRLVK
jgi:N-methylhydantoinase B